MNQKKPNDGFALMNEHGTPSRAPVEDGKSSSQAP
jgi:hypothetical protein